MLMHASALLKAQNWTILPSQTTCLQDIWCVQSHCTIFTLCAGDRNIWSRISFSKLLHHIYLSITLYFSWFLCFSTSVWVCSLSLSLSLSSLHVVEMLMRRCSCRGGRLRGHLRAWSWSWHGSSFRTEPNVIHFRLSSPQRFVVACHASTAAFLGW